MSHARSQGEHVAKQRSLGAVGMGRRPSGARGTGRMIRHPGHPERSRRGEGGFTLLEVMIALAILAAGLALAIAAAASNLAAAHRAQQLVAAVNLARGKMYDIEEELMREGFQELEQSFGPDDFSEEGFPNITWEAKAEKVELPGLAQVQAAAGASGEEGGGGALGGMFGGAGGAAARAGEGGTDPAASAGSGLIASQFETIATVLEMSIRRVTLKVTWHVGKDTEEMTVVCYFTDPTGVDRGLAGSGGGGDSSGEDGGEGEGGSGTGTGVQRGTSTGTRGKGAGR